MLGDLDFNLKPIRPKIHIAKANREIIAKVSEAYDITRKTSLLEIFSFSFKIPYYVEENSTLVRNRNADIIRERYHVKVDIGNKTEWYIISKITDVASEDGDAKEIECVYLPQELNDKKISGYKEDAKNAREVLNDILSLTANWSIEYLDADFELTYRSFEFNDNTLLEAIFTVVDTYNAIIEWDTVNRTFRLVKPELHGLNRLGTISYKKYLKSLNRESNAEIIATRFKPTGKDGLGIQRLNPTGQGYLEDFSYFLFPFERDENKNIISHSYHMSDSLCNALLDYKELLEANEGQFGDLASQRDTLTESLSQKTTELNDFKNELAAITQIQLAQQFDGVMFFEQFNFTGTTVTKTFNLRNPYKYAVLVKVDDVVGKTLTINGQSSYMMSGYWVVSKKVSTGSDVPQTTTLTVTISGSGNTGVFIQVANISEDEFNTSGNEEQIVEKYNFDNKQIQINAKQAEIDSVNSQINSVDQNIDAIRDLLSVENNFTPEQWMELDRFIIEYDWQDDTFIEDTDLYEEAKKRFDELKVPKLTLDIDIVNFLEVLEEQRNWNQLFLGDKVIIKYEMFDLLVEAKIIEMEFDYEQGTVKLTIAQFKDLKTGALQLEKFMHDAKNTTSVVDLNKSRWGQAVVDTSEFSQLFENFWDKVTNQINMAVNQTVTIDGKGITITDPNDPLRFLRLTNGALGLTRSGGLRYETAITADGLIAEMVLGKLILGQRVTIGDSDGIWLTEGPKTTITDRFGREAMKIGLYEENPDQYGILVNRYASDDPNARIINKIIINSEVGFKIQQWNGVEYKDKFYVDNEGLLYSEDMTTKRLKIVSDTDELLLDSYTKFMDIGKFDNIITDGKLTAIEKLQILGERERIKSEYQKLLAQAQAYATTTRDNSIRINPTNFTNAYNDLMNYLNPLLVNMDETSIIDRDEFISKFKNYYDEVVNIVNAINDSIKYSSVQFGAYFNDVIIDYTSGITATRSDNMYRSNMSGTRGFVIQKNIGTAENPNWKDVFWADLDGVVHAQDIQIANSFFVDGGIEGSYIILRDGQGGVVKIYPSQGFWAGAEDATNAPTWIKPDGTAIFKKLIVKDGDNNVIIDSENKKMYMNNFDIVGAGAVDAQLISAKFVTADVGFISDLTAGRLSTLTNAALSDWSNYIVIQENVARWITGTVQGSGTQVTLPDGRPLYWVNSSQTGLMTTEVTAWPVMQYSMNEKEKMIITFEGSGFDAYPSIYMGIGDGFSQFSGKAIITKPADGLEVKSYARSTGLERSLLLKDLGITLHCSNGIIKLEHDSGTNFIITQNGNDITMTHKTSGSITINTSGMTANITGNINLTATGTVNISGTQYNFS